MPVLQWDKTGERKYETGVDYGILFEIDPSGEYVNGVVWNGLTAVTESPSGAEATPLYADNIKYLNLVSYEELSATIEAFTYPPEFEKFDGSASPSPGVKIGQQRRKNFGFCYRTLVGNDIDGLDYGFKIHMIYGCLAAPSEKPHATVNDSPEAITFSWEISTTPVAVGTIGGVYFKPTASVEINSTEVDPDTLTTLLDQLYGTESTDSSMPLPGDVIAMFDAPMTEVTPTMPAFNSGTHTITIPVITGVVYKNKVTGATMTGAVVISQDTLVKAHALAGYKFPPLVDDDWSFDFV